MYLPWSRMKVEHVLMIAQLGVVFCALAVPEWLARVCPWLPVPHVSYLLPTLAPVAMVAWYLSKEVESGGKGITLRIDYFDVLFFVMICTWIIVEIYHAMHHDQPVRIWFIAEYAWAYVAYCVMRSYCQFAGFRRLAFKQIASVIFFLVAAQIAVEIAHAAALQQEARWVDLSELRNNNVLPFMTMFALTLILFEKADIFISWWMQVICLLLTATIIIYEGTRGAMVVGLALVLLYLAALSWNRVTVLKVMFGILLTLPLAGHYWEPIGDMVQRTIQGVQASNITYEESIGVLGGDVSSTFTRYQTIIRAFQRWVEFPVIGLGLEQLEEIKVLNLGIHSNLLTPLLAYGLVGFIPYFAVWIFLATVGVRSHGIAALAYLACAIGMLMFMSQMNWWLGMIIYALLTETDRPWSMDENKPLRQE